MGKIDEQNIDEQQLKELLADPEKAYAMVQSLTALNKQAAEDLSGVKAELDAALAINEKLTGEIEKLSTQKGKTAKAEKTAETISLKDYNFKLDGVKYGFNWFKITHKGTPVTAAEICKDQKLQEDLIGLKSGMIKQL